MSVILFSLLAVLAMAATAVQGACQAGQNFTTTHQLYANIDACAYPVQNLSLSCVNASCPSIATSGTCPLKSDKSIDTTSLANQINQCLSSMTTVCGTGWGPLTFPQMGLGETLALLSYICYIPSEGAAVKGLQKTTVSFSAPSPTTLALTISSPSLTATSPITCAITAAGFKATAISFNADSTKVYKATATINLSATPPTISQVSTSGSTVVLNLALAPQSVDLIGTLVTAVINSLTSVATSSTDAASFATYVATYASMVLQLLKAKCPSS